VAGPRQRHPLVATLGHTTVVLVLLTVGYYLVPLRRWSDASDAARLTGAVLTMVVLGLFLRRATRRSRARQSSEYFRIQQLLTVLYALILGFAMVYAITNAVDPAAFAGMENRTDSLYFSVTTVATVGFGDVHAAGTVARVMVTVQMLFNLIYLGTALRIISGRMLPREE
jgi:voltage-gated potassium channel